MLLSLQGSSQSNPHAILALADGTVFVGNSIGASGQTVGEVVFNTAMTGYQEILTDPSYCQQLPPNGLRKNRINEMSST